MFDQALQQATKAKAKASTKDEQPNQEPQPAVEVVEEQKPESKKKKAVGKRTDPNFKQVGAYIKRDTYLQIQKLLLEQPDKDFSDLVEELLTAYLNKQLTD